VLNDARHVPVKRAPEDASEPWGDVDGIFLHKFHLQN
jgi:hypothetical protein